MKIEWKKITMEDRKLIQSYYDDSKYRFCEKSFANNLYWSEYFQMKYAIVEDHLVFHSNEMTNDSVSYPFGKKPLKKTIDALMQDYIDRGRPFKMNLVTQEEFAELDQLYPGKFSISYDRDEADYLYLSEKLIQLSGKKLHAKKNYVNRFRATYSDWKYEKITDDNRAECHEMLTEWGRINQIEADEERVYELWVARKELDHMEELRLRGGLIRVSGKVIAMTIGEELTEDTFCIHIEKAFTDIKGAYAMINQQFAEHELKGYTYINREEDLGIEGLRKAKLSYAPERILEKGVVTLQCQMR